MINQNKCLSDYTDEDIKEVRAAFRKYCNGESIDFKIYKVFMQGISAMQQKSPKSHIEDAPGYIKVHEDDFPIKGNSMVFCKRMAKAINDMIESEGLPSDNDDGCYDDISDISYSYDDIADNDATSEHQLRLKTRYGDDNRPGRAQRRRDAEMRNRYRQYDDFD